MGKKQNTKNVFSIITEELLEKYAGAKAYKRGVNYYESGAVSSIAAGDNEIFAVVNGSYPYHVKLWAEKGKLGADCDCPAFSEWGGICKHCVAVGLEAMNAAPGALSADDERLKSFKRHKPVVVSIPELRDYFNKMDKDRIIDLLMDQVANDANLLKRFSLEMMSKGVEADKDGIDTYKGIIDAAMRPAGFVDYHHAYDYADNANQAIKLLGQLLKKGRAAEAMELAEYAIDTLERAMGNIDDSDGYTGTLAEDLMDIHLRACKKAKPDPETLARKLFHGEIHSGYDFYYNAMGRYSKVLGKNGIAAYEALARAEWEKQTGGKSSESANTRRGNTNYTLTRIMTNFAEQSGDIEAQADILKTNLSYPYHYLKVAELYHKHKHYDKALEWCEKGLRAFPTHRDARLLDFTAGQYHRIKQHDKAMKYVWEIFQSHSESEEYTLLKKHAEKIKAWPEWREKALAHIREEIAKSKSKPSYMRRDHSTLVRIYLAEKDVDTAWKEAVAGGCHESLWLQLADKRQSDHPLDAVYAYQSILDGIVNEKNNTAYKEGVAILKKIREHLSRAGKAAEFKPYFEQVRANHKPKRNFMKLLVVFDK